MNNNLIITGASGFVGKNLIPYLTLKNYRCQILKRGQMGNHITLKGDAVVHLAGKAHDLRKTVDPGEYYAVNFELTKKIYDFFLSSDVSKFIFISSVKAARDSVIGLLDEETSPNPQTHYGKSKLMAENYIRSQPLPKGKSYYILRPCMIHGPGNKGNLNLLFEFVKKGIPYPLAKFENKRSFLSVENLCFVIESIISGNAESGIYQIADDEKLSTTEVINILADSLGKKSNLWRISPKLITSIAQIGDFLSLPINSDRLDKLTQDFAVSNAKIKKALNISLPFSAKEGLEITAKSFIEEIYTSN